MDYVEQVSLVLVKLPSPLLTSLLQAEAFHPELFGRHEAVHKGQLQVHKAGCWLASASRLVTGEFLKSRPLHLAQLLQSQVLYQTRFLKIEEVVDALKFYEGLVDTL